MCFFSELYCMFVCLSTGYIQVHSKRADCRDKQTKNWFKYYSEQSLFHSFDFVWSNFKSWFCDWKKKSKKKKIEQIVSVVEKGLESEDLINFLIMLHSAVYQVYLYSYSTVIFWLHVLWKKIRKMKENPLSRKLFW